MLTSIAGIGSNSYIYSMNRNLLKALGFLACLSAPPACIAQTDTTTYYDLGYLHLNRAFTQAITIKGTDLEKMPFTHLSDVIGVWAYGAYTGRGTVSYVVDGLPVGDVNGYSIYDIDEIVLVQNATGLVNTGGTQQEIVLVKTRRGKGRRGMTAAGQTGLINSDTGSMHTRMRWYQDYYAGGWLNTGKWSMGFSGDYQRDAWPLAMGTTVTPYNLQRWRLNGYAVFRPDRRNEVEVAVNFVPQRMEYEADSVIKGSSVDGWNKASQNYWLPRLRWRGEWLPGLRNELEGRYFSSMYRERDLSASRDTSYGVANRAFDYDTVSASGAIVRDVLQYNLAFGNWRVRPGFTAIYQYEKYRVGAVELDSEFVSGYPPYWRVSGAAQWGKGHFFTLTPALDISYREVLDVQGGVLRYDVQHQPPGEKSAFPFVTGTVDVLRAINAGAGNSLRLYGSYAQRLWTGSGAATVDGLGGLTDLSDGTAFLAPGGGTVGLSTTTNGGGAYFNAFRIDTVPYWVWEAGAHFSGLGGRMSVDYTYERRNIYKQVLLPLPYYGGASYSVAYPMGPSDLHHFSVQVKAGGEGKWEWRTSVQVTLLRSKLNPSSLRKYETGIAGDISPDPMSWTGGWVNRLRVGRLAVGLDLLWHSGETSIQLNSTGYYAIDTIKLNSMLTPQVYAGYRIPLKGEGSVELFAGSRGLFSSRRQDLADDRRYYTLGAKLGL